MPTRCLFLAFCSALVAACSSPRPASDLRAWGEMRAVLRDGDTSARVRPLEVTGPHTIAVGALAGLEGEITIDGGRALVAHAETPDGEVRVQHARPRDQAALLLSQDVSRWHEVELEACADYEALEARIAEELTARGFELREPTAIRVVGTAERIRLHVVRGACPIARPDGPAPWRYDGPAKRVQLVGFFVDGAAGRWTHHGRRSHLHAITETAMGHVDQLHLSGARLFVPAR